MADFHFTLFAFFLVAGVVLIQIRIPGLAWIAFGVALLVALHWVLKKASKAGGKVREKASKKIDAEWAKIEKAKGSYPKVKVWDDSLHALGKKTAEAVFSKDGEKFSSPKPVSRIAKGIDNFLKGLSKLLGEK